LRAAATQTRSIKLRPAIGSQAADIASKLVWAGQRGTAVRTPTGLAAAKLATEVLTDSTSAWRSYAAALRMLDRYEEALAAFDKAAALHPDGADIQRVRGAVLRYMGRFEEALAAHDKAIAFSPDDAPLHTFRGNTLHCMGRYEEALAAHDKATTLNSRYI